MHKQYIDILLDLPEVRVVQVMEIDEQTVHMKVTPIDYLQACPCCLSANAVIRKGSNRVRKIRHRSMCNKKLYILTPAIRLFCNTCQGGFVWQYAFVAPGKRYSIAFENQAIRSATAATVRQSAILHELPATTLQTRYQPWVSLESTRLQEQAWHDAMDTANLVLGIDDFAIRKGHTYNTGIHDLRGETLLDILPGRKLEDLRAYAHQHPAFGSLCPKAVVMDLAPYYHIWVEECFPGVLRIADRFHVHRYVTEAVQSVRKHIQGTLTPRAKAILKRRHRLLNPQKASLSDEKQEELNEILRYSSMLHKVHTWKEAFGEWYDHSPDVRTADIRLDQWIEQGEYIGHPAIEACLKTIRNWRQEIVNYHRCRWTNATVEGRNNRMKAFQRRHYFTRNRQRYVQGLLVECNQARYAH